MIDLSRVKHIYLMPGPTDLSQAEEINRDQIVWLLQGLRAIGFKRGKEVCFY